jgi:hypothetical protein
VISFSSWSFNDSLWTSEVIKTASVLPAM